MNKIKQFIIHCSASTWGDAKIIDGWHIERGFKKIGYHYIGLNGCRDNSKKYNLVDDGFLEIGRELDNNDYIDVNEKGAHAYGFNKSSIGYCMIGKNKFTLHQFMTLTKVCHYWKILIPDIKIIGHYEISKNKTCPNFDVKEFKDVMNYDSVELELELLKRFRKNIFF